MEPLSAEDPVRIGPFRLLGRLGSGGMGRVYLARSAGGRTVAVKVVHAELAAQDEFRRRFAREVAALEKVGGAGTAPVLGSDTGAGAPWVAIAYVAGPPLRTVVGGEYGPLPPASVRSLAAGLAGALEHVHAAGLVHRDLKPANVLLTVDGPRIIDFGIARAVDTVTDGGLTSTGALVGSPGYMSPEQVRGERLTPASDVFCLGSVLVYAATGRPPFGAADSGVHATMFRIAHDEPDLTGLPAELDELVRGCLAKDPAARPTAAHLAAHVEAADPWLPAGLLAQLGRLAARLLDEDGGPDQEGPTARDGATGAEGSAARDGAATEGRTTGGDANGGDANGDAPTGPAAVAEPPGRPRPRPRRGRRRLVAGVVAVVAAAAVAVAYATAGHWDWPGRPGGGTTTAGDEQPGNVVPAAFLGAWEGVLKGTDTAPYETARIEITKGRPGDKAGVYVHVAGERLCMGRSTLVSADDDTIVFGESDVTTSVPAGRCTPAAHQKLTVRSPDVLQWSSGAASATFRRARSGPEAVPAALVGHWDDVPHPDVADPNQDLYSHEVIITQGPVGAPLVRFEQSFPLTDEETGEPLPGGDTVNCASTAVLGGAGTLLVVGPATPDTAASDRACSPSGASSNLRIQRVGGEDRLLLYGMDADGEPGEFSKEK
ncbi:serine/threonine-protein kinase [Streptomyces ficellus]|uniref:Serine/threonine protein kinase n=1 Tax=Streptomyces ficellus TaxID=1977088 RepID=A0A6I6FP24_9ACTN|nr:serine/threonine-protein kinase [Streptomyces ficellus]QGV79408.1 serine/threonine protein kinase [Streptomyces ficellus]